jgi:hypothetical protein
MTDEIGLGSLELEPEDRFLTLEESDDLNAAERVVEPVSYAGQDFDVDGLIRRLEKRDIVIPSFGTQDDSIVTAGFQRGFVWTRGQMDRFIESILLGYPIPGLFLVRQRADKRYLVLDGQQRLRTLLAFKKGIHNDRRFALTNVADEFKDLTYETLPDALRRTFDDAFIQATIVSTDETPSSLDAVYQIFERLNSGGTQLTPHEIRVALYAGPLIEELERLNSLESWRALYGEKKNSRLRDQELVLRVLALFIDEENYARPLKVFLNRFAGAHRYLDGGEVGLAADLFEKATLLLSEGPGPGALRKGSSQVNAAQSEALIIGLMRRLASSPIAADEVTIIIEALVNDLEFDAATARATADEQVVEARLSIATQAFSEA